MVDEMSSQSTATHPMVEAAKKYLEKDINLEFRDIFGSHEGLEDLVVAERSLRMVIEFLSRLPGHIFREDDNLGIGIPSDLLLIYESYRDRTTTQALELSIKETPEQREVRVKSAIQEVIRTRDTLFMACQRVILERYVVSEEVQGKTAHAEEVLLRLNRVFLEATERKDEIDKTLDRYKNSLTAKAAGDHATNFSDLKKWHNRFAALSLVASGVLMYCIFIALQSLAATPASSLPLLISKLSLPVVLLAALLVTLKLFSAERHNALVNEQRSTALKTFHAFIDGAYTEATKDAVLIQTTSAIFGPQPTGYLKAPVEVQNLFAGVLGSQGQIGKD